MHEEWKGRTLLTVNEIGLSAIETSVEEEALDIGIARAEDSDIEEEVLDIGMA